MPRPGPRPQQAFDQALERGDAADAWFHAHHLPMVPLYKALWLTILIADRQGDDGYQKVCRRFVERFVRECRPTMDQVKRVCDALETLDEPMLPEWGAARVALLDLAEQLRGDGPGPRPGTPTT